jgi:Fe-S cluster assembly protein SufB
MGYTENELAKDLENQEYKFGFVTNIASDKAPKGLNEDIIRFISSKKNEPEWLLEHRLKAFSIWKEMTEPEWAHVHYEKPDFQDITYYSAPKQTKKYESWDDVDPELKETMAKLGISMEEQQRLTGVDVDFVMDSVSVATSFKSKLKELGIIFCSFSEAVQEYPDLVKKYMGTVVPVTDNFYAALNSAVFTDGSFCYIPKGVKCPMELSTYFRINEGGTGQFERTLVVADEGSYVSYLEGCTAPQRDENQLHAAVVELIALDNAEININSARWSRINKCTKMTATRDINDLVEKGIFLKSETGGRSTFYSLKVV